MLHKSVPIALNYCLCFSFSSVILGITLFILKLPPVYSLPFSSSSLSHHHSFCLILQECLRVLSQTGLTFYSLLLCDDFNYVTAI